MNQSYEERLAGLVGCELIPERVGQDPVNIPMVRHWVEAMADTNPIYLDGAAAQASGRSDVVAPAAMMQAWTMPGYTASVESGGARTAMDELEEVLGAGGYTSVVATDSEFEFHREAVLGDHLSLHEVLEGVSAEKHTAIGTGRFVTTVRTYRNQHGEVLATQRWRTLRYRPAPAPEPEPERAPRPRPALNPDNAFWFEAAHQHRLAIQRCVDCAELRHPPGPCCPGCGSFAWDTVTASGQGTIYSYVVVHHPPHPAFDYPLLVALVELQEGTRLVSNLVGVEPDAIEIGMPVVVTWLEADSELTLPVFRPKPGLVDPVRHERRY